MWRKIGQIVLVVAIWGAIAAYVVCSAMLAHSHKSSQSVERVAIEIADSTASGQLITSQRVKEMLLERGIATINTNVNLVDTRAIKELICSEGFIDDVDIYASYSGTLHICISQRTPLLRFRVDGYDCYITADGYIFQTPSNAALYVPVVTGDYTPLFDKKFEGKVADVRASMEQSARQQIATIGEGRKAVAERKEYWSARRRSVRDSVITERRERQRLYDYIDGHLRDCNRDFQKIESKQAAVVAELEQKLVELADFERLIEFVGRIERDRFWRAEIVQIVATRSSDRSLWLTLIPRSGNHRIEFGWLADVDSKLQKLRIFYDNIAVTSGWDSYKSVNLNYADRVVCTYRKDKK